MKTLPTGMQSSLDSGATTLCLCWKLTREDSTVMGFTDHDNDVVFGSVTYKAATGLNGTNIRTTLGLNIDNMETVGALSSAAITEEDISRKLYDNAAISVYRVDYTDTAKHIEVFTGFLGQVTRGKLTFKAEVNSLNSVLNQGQGQVYQKTCNVDLFSSKCGVDVNANPNYKKTGTVSEVLSRRTLKATDAGIIAQATNWFTAGKLTWTSGANNGLAVEVKTHVFLADNTAAFDLWEAMPQDIQIGDTFEVRVGCDKAIETCKAKFNNVANFRGFPRMPGQDAVTTYALKKNVNDGGSWYS